MLIENTWNFILKAMRGEKLLHLVRLLRSLLLEIKMTEKEVKISFTENTKASISWLNVMSAGCKSLKTFHEKIVVHI